MASEKAGYLDGFNETLKWTIGLINHQGKYLTCEQFQARVSVGGSSLRKKQVWTLEPQDNGKVAFKNYLGKFLGSDKDGKVSGNAEEVEANSTFEIITQGEYLCELNLSNILIQLFLVFFMLCVTVI